MNDLEHYRNLWILAENNRTKAYKDFMDANKDSPLRKELESAEAIEKQARAIYVKALGGNIETSNSQ